MQDPEILSKPLNDLSVSRMFKKGSAMMGFRSLRDIVNTTPADLIAKEAFNYIWFGELIDILTEYGQLHLLQPTQGNSRV
jgi:hypothetical protein